MTLAETASYIAFQGCYMAFQGGYKEFKSWKSKREEVFAELNNILRERGSRAKCDFERKMLKGIKLLHNNIL